MTFPDHIEAIRTGIRAGRFTNEASVSQGIVLRLLSELGWPTYDVEVVRPEYALAGRRVDYALCGPKGKPLAFIEVKQVGKGAGAEQQLFEYAFHEGVQLAVLTDGQEWSFFLPAEQGSYGERRVYKLDLVEREVEESAERLQRYLSYADSIDGHALTAAREDFRNAAKSRLMTDALPQAWNKLVEDEEELLLELVADCVEDLCGYKPEPDVVAEFLKTQIRTSMSTREVTPTVARASRTTAPVTPPAPGSNQAGYGYRGTFYPCRNGRDVLTSVLLKLAETDPSFFERFAGLPKHGRSRRFIAADRLDLYPNRPDLARAHSVEIAPGWWVGTNVSKNQITTILKMACEVVGIQLGSALTINLGE